VCSRGGKIIYVPVTYFPPLKPAREENPKKKWWPEGHLIFHSRVIYTLVTVRQLRLIGVSLLVTRPAHTLKEGPLLFRIKIFKIILLFILKRENRKSQPTMSGNLIPEEEDFSLSFFFFSVSMDHVFEFWNFFTLYGSCSDSAAFN
jgi:hypothetical protein